MSPVAVDEHLAHLLQVQGGLLDAYLEQNLGHRFAYAIMVWEPSAPSRVRTVTNIHDQADLRGVVKAVTWLAPHVEGDTIPLDRAPAFVDSEAS